jgi:hypothetical protein
MPCALVVEEGKKLLRLLLRQQLPQLPQRPPLLLPLF